MRVIVGFMFLIGIAFGLVFYKFNLSPTQEGFVLSLIAGMAVFIIVSGLIYSNPGIRKKKNWNSEENMRKRKIRANIIGFVFMIIVIILFFNFYFYFKALVGNDMLISLDVDKHNFILENMEWSSFNVKAKILTSPFCSANCSLVLEDLAENKILNYERMHVKLSSPFSREYIINSNEDKFGQKLYKLTLECSPVKEEKLCYIYNDLPKVRTNIISVNYELNDIQNIIKSALKNDTEEIARNFYRSENTLNSFYFNISSLDLSDLEYESELIKSEVGSLSWDIGELSYLYSEQEYSDLGTEIVSAKNTVWNFTDKVMELNNSLFSRVMAYNSLIDNINTMYSEILFLEDYYFTNSSLVYAESFVKNFNSMITEIKKKESIENKIILFNSLIAEKNNLFSIIQGEKDSGILGDRKIEVSIYPVNIPKVYLNYEDYSSNFTLEEPSPVCCFRKECYKCIDDSSLNYPLILVHGHSFNERLSAELSMESFSDMAQAFERDGYLDAGYFYRSKYEGSPGGYLGGINASIVVEATYYLDSSSTGEDSFIYDSKWDSIDVYSLRLKDIIDNVLYITGKDKVIIVAHSMGSLVTRRYMQLYGEDNLDRVVLIGGPNKGIDGLVLNSCSVFGADVECSEMNKSSEFMEELNNSPVPNIPVYNIIGLGCQFEGVDSDGIVKEESAYLEWAENIYVNGTCTGVDFFHVRMIKPTLHPEIYEIVKGIIDEDICDENM